MSGNDAKAGRADARKAARAYERFARGFRLTQADRVRYLARGGAVRPGLLLAGTALATSLYVFQPVPAAAQVVINGVDQGPTVTAPPPSSAATITVGTAGNGTLNVDAGTLTVTNNNGLLVSTGAGTGTVNISNGGSLSALNTPIGFGTGVAAMTISGAGSAFSDSGAVAIGFGTNSNASVTLNAGTFSSVNATVLGLNANSSGTFTNNGGTHSSQFMRLGNAAGAVATYNLNGGVTATGLVGTGGGTSTFNFNGGTLQATGNGAFMQGLTAANVRAGGAIIDTQANIVGIAQDLLDGGGGGGLTKQGTGTLTLTGANTYTGATTISGGTLNANASAALGDGSATNTLVFNGGTLQAGGTIASPATRGVSLLGAGTIDTAGNAVSIAGVIAGAGALTKTGAGTLTLTGANTNSGSVTISGGTLNANSSAALGDGSVTNTLIFNGGTLQAGGAIASPATRGVSLLGAGTIDTAGNAVSIAGVITGAGAFSKSGAGTLTLSGVNTYTGGTTIGGGTLALSGSGSIASSLGVLNSSVFDISAITGASTSVVSYGGAGSTALGGKNLTVTNGSGLVSGVISGAGGSITLSAGSLTLTGVNTYTGATTINGGTLALSGGGSIATSSGVVNSGTFDISGISAAGTTIGTLSGAGGTTLGAKTLTIADGGGNTYSGVASGTGGGLTLTAGTFTLTGVNTYTGATTINGGTLALSGGGSVATSSGVVNGGTFDISAVTGADAAIAAYSGAGATTLGSKVLTITAGAGGVYSGVASGTGGITLQGGTQTLSGANTYTGATTVSGGTLSLGASNVLANASTLVVNGGTFAIGANSDTVAGVSLQSGAITGTGGTLTSTANFDVRNGSVSPILGGAVGLDKTMADTVTLSGVNTYTGATTISGGTLALSGGGSIAASSGVVNSGTFDISGISAAGTTIGTLSGAGGTTLGAKTLTIADGGGNTYSGVASGTGGGLTLASDDFTLTGANTYTGATTVNGGTLNIGAGGTTGQLGFDGTTFSNVAVAGGANLTFNRSDAYTYGGAISGAGGVNQSGAGTTILTGASTAYTGTAAITAGILRVDGTFGGAASTVNVSGSGTLQGTGTVGGTVNVNGGGTLSPGASPGTLTIGALNINGGSTTLFELGQSGVVGGANNDFVNVTGNLAINGGTLNLRDAAGGNTLVTGSYRLFNYGGTGTFNAANNAAGRGGFDVVSSGPGSTAIVYTNVPNQVNALLQNGGQLAQFWDGADTTGNGVVNGGSGTFNATNTNWTTQPGAQVNDVFRNQVGIFAGAAGTVAVAGAIGFQGFQFSTDGYVINGPGTLNITGDPFTTAAQSFFNTDAGVTATVNAGITGNAGIGLRKIGGGTLQLGGASTYTGASTVEAGALTVLAGGSIVGTSSLTNSATFTLNGGGTVTTGGAFTNNAGATANVAGTLNGGSIANAGTFGLTGAATAATVANNNGGTFNSAGALNGTTAVTNNAGGTFNLSGGTVTTPNFANNGTLNSTGGAIATPTFTNTALVNGLLTITGNTTASNTGTGVLSNGINIAAAPGGATFSNAGTAGSGGLVLGNIGGAVTANNTGTFFGNVATQAGTTTTVNNASTWNYQGISTLPGIESISNTGSFNVVAAGVLNGLETFTNSGRVVLTAADLSGSIATFTNSGSQAANTGVFLEGRTMSGIGVFNNNGYLLSVPQNGAAPTNAVIGATTFNNGANGVISLVNNQPIDSLTLTGNYNGSAGSQIRLDVDLNQASRRADVVRINGQNNGQTTLVLNRIDNPSSALFSSQAIPVVVSGGGAGQVSLSQPIQGNGFVTFELEQNGPGSYQIVSRLNTSAASGAAASISGLLTSLNVGFFQSVSAFIGAPTGNSDERTASTSVSSDPKMSWAQLNRAAAAQTEIAAAPGIRPNTISSGLWARGSGGEFTVRGTSRSVFGATTVPQAVRVENSFAGMQVGIDTGVFNIDNSGWNLHLGVTGGSVFADGRQRIGAQTTGTFDVPFVGTYAAVTNGPFFSDLSYRHDFYNARITNQLAGLNSARLSIESDSVAASAGYRFDYEGLAGTELPYFVEPSGSMSYTNTSVGNLPVTGGTLQFQNIESILGRFGLRFGTAFQATESLALQPFVTGSIWHEFAADTVARFVSANIVTDPNAFVPILTNRVGTFGQVGVGVSAQVLDTPFLGYIRSDFRFGDRLEGYAVNGGVRYQF